LNLQASYGASTSSWCVCQFHHRCVGAVTERVRGFTSGVGEAARVSRQKGAVATDSGNLPHFEGLAGADRGWLGPWIGRLGFGAAPAAVTEDGGERGDHLGSHALELEAMLS
jgi:hypothetical protein